MDEKIRTPKQRNALQLYCRKLSELLNESGISQAVFFQEMEADYTEEMIKGLFRKFAKVKYNKDSTAKLNRGEVIAIYDEINRHIAKFGLHMAWPSEEELYYQSQ